LSRTKIIWTVTFSEGAGVGAGTTVQPIWPRSVLSPWLRGARRGWKRKPWAEARAAG